MAGYTNHAYRLLSCDLLLIQTQIFKHLLKAPFYYNIFSHANTFVRGVSLIDVSLGIAEPNAWCQALAHFKCVIFGEFCPNFKP